METPTLELLMAGYFHQDWREDYSSYDQAVGDFLTGQPGDVQTLLADIDAALAAASSDEELGAYLRHLGRGVDPTLIGTTNTRWLRDIRDQARSALTARR